MTQFEIPGRPVPKGRPRWTGTRMVTPKATRAAQEAVYWTAHEAGLRLSPDKRYTVELDFYTNGHADGDNLEKLCLDGLQMGGEFNDRQVTSCKWRIIPDTDEKTVVRIREALNGGGNGPSD